MNSRTAERERQHRIATKKAAQMKCIACHSTPCVPAHYPRHRGSGGRFENDWADEHWVPLCRRCHDLLDRRLGVSEAVEFQRQLLIKRVERYKHGEPVDPTEW